MRKLHQALSFLVALLVTSSPLADSPAENQTVLVFDASGSMWGQINSVAKVTIAKTVVKDIVESWDKRTEFGLIAYGHRTEKDCNDIEYLVPLGPINYTLVLEKLSKIKPLGKTPLTEAVKQAADSLSAAGRSGTIILLTDGLETCSGDPCALGKTLAKHNLRLTTHVIGFDLEKENTSALQCLAKETGGQYFEASDAEALDLALGSASKLAENRFNVFLRAVDSAGVVFAKNSAITWQISNTVSHKKIATAHGSEVEFYLPPATYLINASQGEDANLQTTITVPSDDTFSKDIMFANGEIHLDALLASGMPSFDKVAFNWEVFRSLKNNTRQRVAKEAGKKAVFILPSGDYIARISAEDFSMEFEIEIVSRETRQQSIILNAGRIIANGIPGTSWNLYKTNDKGNRVRAATEARASTEFLVSAGVYEIEAGMGKAVYKESIVLDPGATQTVNASFD